MEKYLNEIINGYECAFLEVFPSVTAERSRLYQEEYGCKTSWAFSYYRVANKQVTENIVNC